MAFEPPGRLSRTLTETYGAPAAPWLAGLPELAARAVADQGLGVERVVEPGGRSALVVLVRRPDGSPATLKIVPPFAAPVPERVALAAWRGRGAVDLLDATGTTLLLERLHPEMSLRSLPEAKSLLEAADTVRKLWIDPPADHPFETVKERTARQAARMREAADADLATAPLVDAALVAREELCATATETLLLHGAFRQGKVLAGDRAPWLAVGPEPLTGERAYDLARLARDRVEDLVAAAPGASSTRRRVRRLADSLDMDQDRVRGWALFRAVESGTRALGAGRRQEGELLLEYASWL